MATQGQCCGSFSAKNDIVQHNYDVISLKTAKCGWFLLLRRVEKN